MISATVRQQVRVALTAAGFDVIEAVDGEDGLLEIRSDAEIIAVICDINMPRKTGLDRLEEIRRGESNAQVAVLMLTSEGPELIARAKMAGAKGWLVKPFKPHLLVAAMQRLTA
jgi:two-component system, chemotaxis family, chemotaxis protein CheY